MKLISDAISAYVELHSTPSSIQLENLQRETFQAFDSANMLSGPQVGRLLEFLVYALEARSVLEIGTFSGYSALAMAEGLPPEGRVVTLEINEAHAEVARRAIAGSPYAERIELMLGPALESLGSLPAPSTSSSSTPTRRAISTTTRRCCPSSLPVA